MHLLKHGREAFLEYLRNLTPQIALLAIAGLLASKIALELTAKNVALWVAFLAVFCTFALALVASAFQFLERSCKSLPWAKAIATELEIELPKSVFRRFGYYLSRTWQLKRSVFAELILSTLVIQVGTLAIGTMAVYTGFSVSSVASGP